MVKLVAIFKKPADTSTFEDHYRNVHLGLVRKMPGLKRLELSTVTGAPVSTPQYYRMAEMYFDDQTSLTKAIMSREGMAAAKDLMGFAKDVVQMFYAEISE
jgi:uncharacterized protein (TIGR02118 family)